MSATLTLPSKFTSNADDDIAKVNDQATDCDTHIDGTQVRMLGALAAEALVRFATKVRKGGSALSMTLSADMEDDLKTIGLYDILTGKEAAQ